MVSAIIDPEDGGSCKPRVIVCLCLIMWCPMDEGRGGVIVVAAGADAAACRRQVRQHGAVEGGLTVVSRKRNCISGSIRIFRVIHLDLIAILLLAASTAAVQDWDKKQQTRNTTDGTVGEVTVCVIGGPGFPPFVSSKVHVRISEVPEVTVYGVDEFLNAYEGLDVDLLLAILW